MWISGRGCLTLMCGFFLFSILVGAINAVPAGAWPVLGWIILVAIGAFVFYGFVRGALKPLHWFTHVEHHEWCPGCRSDRLPPAEVGPEDTPDWKK